MARAATAATVRRFLETPHPIETLEVFGRYQRIHDGGGRGYLNVVMGPDGDMHIAVIDPAGSYDEWRRRRTASLSRDIGGYGTEETTCLTFGGDRARGGSWRTHRGLQIVAEAIRLDTTERAKWRNGDLWQKDVRRLLEDRFNLDTINPTTHYRRTHDDCDGDRGQQLSICKGIDGKMHVSVLGDNLSLRFRTYIGGGLSLRVHMALRILAEAIRLDNEEFPQGGVGPLMT